MRCTLIQKYPIEPRHFWDIVHLPIKFKDTIESLEQENNYCYLDVGPSGTLATFVKYNLSKNSRSKSIPILTPFSQNLINLDNLRDILR